MAATGPHQRADRDALIRAIAGRQHGVVTRKQLIDAGVPVHAIDERVRDGRLARLHRATYRAAGPVRSVREPEMAAVLACGEGALLSHRSAAALLALLPVAPLGSPIDVSLVVVRRRPRPGIRVHRLTTLDDTDRTTRDAIPVTAPARTILDLAAIATPREVEQAAATAERMRLATREDLTAVVDRYGRAPGAALLRSLLAAGTEPAFTRSVAEEKLLEIVRSAGLPAPRLNGVVLGYEVDFLWAAERLVVEVDGLAYHGSDAAIRRDHRRDTELAAAGYTVVHVTWDDLARHRDPVMGRLCRIFGRLDATAPARAAAR